MLNESGNKEEKQSIIDENIINKIIDSIYKQAIDGAFNLTGCIELADEYRNNKKFTSIDGMVDSIIKWESTKNFGSGFITGLGGAITLPVTIPLSLYTSWVVQARLAGAIASLYSHPLEDNRVRTFILLSIMGNKAIDILKEAGITMAGKFAKKSLKNISGKILSEINKKAGFHLITKTGDKVLKNLSKVIPIAGALVGGTMDAVSCVITGRTARAFFGKGKLAMDKKIEGRKIASREGWVGG